MGTSQDSVRGCRPGSTPARTDRKRRNSRCNERGPIDHLQVWLKWGLDTDPEGTRMLSKRVATAAVAVAVATLAGAGVAFALDAPAQPTVNVGPVAQDQSPSATDTEPEAGDLDEGQVGQADQSEAGNRDEGQVGQADQPGGTQGDGGQTSSSSSN